MSTDPKVVEPWESDTDYGYTLYLYLYLSLQVIQFLEDGILLQKPTGCPDDIYHVMLGCWRRDPQERFAFDRVHRHLVELADGDGGTATTTASDRPSAGGTSAPGGGRRSLQGTAAVDRDDDQEGRRQDEDSAQQQQQQQQQQLQLQLQPSWTLANLLQWTGRFY